MYKFLSTLFVGSAGIAAGVTGVLFWTEAPLRNSQPLANAAIVETDSPVKSAIAGPHSEIGRSQDGLFYVTGSVNGVNVRFVVDTGATVVVLTPADASRAGVKFDNGKGKARLQTASGSSSMHWAKVDNVTVAGQQVKKLDAAIVRDGLKVSLLGQNYLSQLNSLTLKGDKLHLN